MLMKNKFHNYIFDNINSSIFQFKFLFFFQWFIITFGGDYGNIMIK